jgi:hypothetical protein
MFPFPLPDELGGELVLYATENATDGDYALNTYYYNWDGTPYLSKESTTNN